MKRTLFALTLLLSGMIPVGATQYLDEVDFSSNPIDEVDYNSNHSMGCMLLGECTAGVVEITSTQDLLDYYGEYSELPAEFEHLLEVFDTIGIKVFIAPDEYFVQNTRGVYHTVSNNFFLNAKYMQHKHHLMSVVRHEGWHAAQDCMAGSIHNSYIAVIHNSEDVPELWKELAERTYPKSVVPWEQEAGWAGRTEGMTLSALRACASPQPIWETFEPTPLTRQFLIDKGYIKL